MSKYQELVKSFDNIRKISQDFFLAIMEEEIFHLYLIECMIMS